MVTVVLEGRGRVVWRGPKDVTILAAPPDSALDGALEFATALRCDVDSALAAPASAKDGTSLQPGSPDHAIAALSALPGAAWVAVSLEGPERLR